MNSSNFPRQTSKIKSYRSVLDPTDFRSMTKHCWNGLQNIFFRVPQKKVNTGLEQQREGVNDDKILFLGEVSF